MCKIAYRLGALGVMLNFGLLFSDCARANWIRGVLGKSCPWIFGSKSDQANIEKSLKFDEGSTLPDLTNVDSSAFAQSVAMFMMSPEISRIPRLNGVPVVDQHTLMVASGGRNLGMGLGENPPNKVDQLTKGLLASRLKQRGLNEVKVLPESSPGAFLRGQIEKGNSEFLNDLEFWNQLDSKVDSFLSQRHNKLKQAPERVDPLVYEKWKNEKNELAMLQERLDLVEKGTPAFLEDSVSSLDPRIAELTKSISTIEKQKVSLSPGPVAAQVDYGINHRYFHNVWVDDASGVLALRFAKDPILNNTENLVLAGLPEAHSVDRKEFDWSYVKPGTLFPTKNGAGWAVVWENYSGRYSPGVADFDGGLEVRIFKDKSSAEKASKDIRAKNKARMGY